MEGNKYREAVHADYYTAEKFFIKGAAKYTGWQTIDGKVYFRSMDAMQGKRYEVIVTQADEYDLYGYTEDYRNEVEFTE